MLRSIQSTLACTTFLLIFGITFAHAAPPVANLEYDANGNNTKIADPSLNRSTTQQYDAVNRLIQQNQPHATTANTQQGNTITQYNAIDEVTGVTDPRSLSTAYTKNAYGDVLTLTSPDTGTTINTYDNAGNLNTRTDARGKVATYSYDATNRITQISHASGGTADETITYSYDQSSYGVGHLTGMTDLSGSTAWSYDEQSRITLKQQLIGTQLYNLQTLYDTDGRLTRMVYPSGRYVACLYNSNGQVEHIFVNGNVLASNIQYHATGSLKSWIWANGQTYSRSIDTDGRTAQYTVGDKLQIINYDNAGRLTQSYRALPATPTTPIIYSTSTYVYDNLDRITNHVIDTANPTNSTGYAYDLSGNRTNLNLGASQYPSTIATTSNRLTADTGSINRTYTYDASGNITGDGQDTYTYYNSGRLKQVTRNGNNLYSLQYNGLGQFVHRTNSNTHYVYDAAGHLLGEYTSTGSALQETIYLGDTPIAVITPTNQVNYIYTDHLNTPRLITNYANQQRWIWYPEQSGAFGDGLPNDNPNNAVGGQLGSFTYNLRFPGQLYDAASGLSYNYYRDYNSRTGRYIESDPIGLAGGINTYAYVGGNPLSFTDPFGLEIQSPNTGGAPNSRGPLPCSGNDCVDPPASPGLPDKGSPSAPSDAARYDMCKEYDLLKKPCKFCVDFACSKAPQYCCKVEFDSCIGSAIDSPEVLAKCNAQLATCTFRGN